MTAAVREVTAEQRRRRLWTRHHLARPIEGGPADAATVARDLVALHATDPASVFLGLRARVRGLAVEDVERALYEDRSLARILAMRRTMFVAPRESIPTLHAAASWALARTERRRNLRLLAMGGVDDPETWLEQVADRTVAALRELGEATAAELTEAVPELGLRVAVNQGKKWAGKIGMSSRVLLWLAVVGRVSRARPRGTWRSTLYRWAPTGDWIGVELDRRPEDPQAARVELGRLYLRAFGPASFDDLHWWTGWNKTQTRKVVSALEPLEVELGAGRTGLLLADRGEEIVGPEPVGAGERDDGVTLLPALDTTTMGWKERDWYVGELEPRLFDRNGNAGPTVWHAGRIIGGWAQRHDGEIVVRLLVDVGREVAGIAEEAAARLEAWLGDTVVVPRFRTPLERELSA